MFVQYKNWHLFSILSEITMHFASQFIH